MSSLNTEVSLFRIACKRGSTHCIYYSPESDFVLSCVTSIVQEEVESTDVLTSSLQNGHVDCKEIILYVYTCILNTVIIYTCTCTQWCGNSQSCRTLSDKSSECLVN